MAVKRKKNVGGREWKMLENVGEEDGWEERVVCIMIKLKRLTSFNPLNPDR